MIRPVVHIIILGAWVAGALVSCGRAPPENADAPASRHLVGEGGPLRLTMTVAPTSLDTSQRIRVRFEMLAASGVEPAEPDLAAALPEGLTVVGSSSDARDDAGGTRIIFREFDIEPFLPGEYTIAAVSIGAKHSTGEAIPPVSTQPVEIKVESVLPPGTEELAAAKSIVEPPRAPVPWFWIGVGAALAILALGGAMLWLRRPPPLPEPIRVAAHDLAFRRLDALMARRLVESGRFDVFYSEASLLLRRYIEDRFGLHAPERTTEEFLEESRASSFLMEEDVRVLQRFLGHCDLVKFAAVIPSTRDAEAIAATIREFVDRTRDARHLVVLEGEEGKAA